MIASFRPRSEATDPLKMGATADESRAARPAVGMHWAREKYRGRVHRERHIRLSSNRFKLKLKRNAGMGSGSPFKVHCMTPATSFF